jgi:hypothetical protein
MVAALAGAGLAAALTVFPLERSWLGLILLAYGVTLCWRPRLWLLLLPMLLPALDLAPVTGWFFFDESDLLLLLTVMVSYASVRRLGPGPAAQPGDPRLPAGVSVCLAVLAIAWAVGVWRGARPWPPPDLNAFNNYLSPYNALRIGKAWGWALLLWMPLRRTAGARLEGLSLYLLPGMLAGLAFVVLAAVRERAWFPGLTDFSSDYRITAPFSAMHTGGAALDGYLALCVPLLALPLGGRWGARTCWIALPLLAGAAYVSLTTFSRGLYAALGFALLILLAGPACRAGQRNQRGLAVALAGAVALAYFCQLIFVSYGYRGLLLVLAATAAGALLYRYTNPISAPAVAGLPAMGRRAPPLQPRQALAGLLLVGLAVPICNSDYVRARFGNSGGDLQQRLTHWRHALLMMEGDPWSSWIGMGLGTFPATYFWHNPGREQPPSYRYVDQRNNRYLQLRAPAYAHGYGERLRILQRVSVQPWTPYMVELDVRNPGPPAYLHVNLCARQLLYPQQCTTTPLPLLASGDAWRHYQFVVNAALLGRGPPYWRAPVQLELSAEGQDATLDVDNVSLRDAITEHEQLRNGSFTDGNDYWFFSSDRHHLPWHIKNMALNLYFELGALGLAAYTGLLLAVGAALLRRMVLDERGAAAWLASLTAFHAVGLFDSLLDVPRIALLSMLLMCASALRPANAAAGAA